MGCTVTRESGCTGLLATFDSSGELQTKRPTELSDRPYLQVWISCCQNSPFLTLEIQADIPLRWRVALVNGARMLVEIDDFCCIPCHLHPMPSTLYHTLVHLFCALLGATLNIPWR
jgi:hypothetical protein